MCRESTKNLDFALSRSARSTDRARAQSAIRSFKHSEERLVDYGNTRRDISKNSTLGKVGLFCELVILIPRDINSCASMTCLDAPMFKGTINSIFPASRRPLSWQKYREEFTPFVATFFSDPRK